DRETLRDFGVTDSNDALEWGTGLVVDRWETNRTSYSSRGFDVMLTQIDGLGMSNDWGLVVGQQDTYLFEKIELVRGANGLLTLGSHNQQRVALDYNKVLTQDGKWAGRLVVVNEDKDSHLRALNDRRTAIYGVVEGQIGLDGVLTIGMTHQDNKQRSPMWGS